MVRAQRDVQRPAIRAPASGRALTALAGRQHGVVSTSQLRALGMDRAAVRRRVANGLLHPIHHRVYTLGRAALSVRGRYQAALLACGDSAWLSHHSAAALWDLRPSSSGLVHVTVQAPGSRRRSGIAVHTARSLKPADVATCESFPCTSVARTLLDVAATADVRSLDRLIERAQVLRLFDGFALAAILDASNGKPGVRALRARLVGLADEPPPFRSELERRFLELVRSTGLPKPVVNGHVAGYEVDFHWHEQRFVVETDGRATHGTPQAVDRDRRRDLDLSLAGWRVRRLSRRQVVEEPSRVCMLLRKELAESGRQGP